MASKRIIRAMLAVVSVGLALLAASAARAAGAAGLECGAVITTGTYTLTRDLSCSGTAIWIEQQLWDGIDSSGVTIDLAGHTITGDGTGDGVLFTDMPRFGFPAPGPANILNGTIQGFADGVRAIDVARDSAGGVLANLTLLRNGIGIDFEPGNDYHFQISDNIIAHNGSGFVGAVSHSIDFERNLVSGNQGIGVAFFTNSGALTFRNNLIVNNGGDGLRLGDAKSVVIGNQVTGNGGDGIVIDSPLPTPWNAFFQLSDNVAIANAKLGIDALAAVGDGGGNIARHNGDPRQCLNIFCSRF